MQLHRSALRCLCEVQWCKMSPWETLGFSSVKLSMRDSRRNSCKIFPRVTLETIPHFTPILCRTRTASYFQNRSLLAKKLFSLQVLWLHKSAKGVWTKPLFQELAVPGDGPWVCYTTLWCIFKFYNCHVKRSESGWYCQLQGSGSQQFELG